jgi:hypothetical protein
MTSIQVRGSGCSCRLGTSVVEEGTYRLVSPSRIAPALQAIMHRGPDWDLASSQQHVQDRQAFILPRGTKATRRPSGTLPWTYRPRVSTRRDAATAIRPDHLSALPVPTKWMYSADKEDLGLRVVVASKGGGVFDRLPVWVLASPMPRRKSGQQISVGSALLINAISISALAI